MAEDNYQEDGSTSQGRTGRSTSETRKGLRVPKPDRFQRAAEARQDFIEAPKRESKIKDFATLIASVIAAVFKSPRQPSAVFFEKRIFWTDAPVFSPKATPADVAIGSDLAKHSVVVQPAFKMVFLTVAGMTIVAGAMEVILAFAWTMPTANQQSAFEAMGFAWKAGLGSIFGLLGGKLT